jgi:RNA polymerase sigma factor (sigma-70 family)
VEEQHRAGDSAICGSLPVKDVSDAELLERFVTNQDEAAFAALMARHGPMVYGVCRRLLRHAQDAEDAFQATFLILVRKAASIGKRELLANWLYGVALRVAHRARLAAQKRQTREAADMERIATATHESPKALELSASLEEEVQRLPAKYRDPVVLYYLQGRTNEEIAGELRCPVNTIKTRLSRAREMLRKRLTRRGLALSAGAIVTALSPEALTASVPPALIDSTVKAAICFAAGDTVAGGVVSAPAAALTKGELHTMFVTKMKTLAVLVLALAMIVGGVGAFAYHRLATEPDRKEKSKSDNDAIQGNWEVVSLTSGKEGDTREAEALKNATWVFEKEKLLVKIKKEDKTLDISYKLDPEKNPKTIDFKLKAEAARERNIEGIYELKGDDLTICIPSGRDNPRPTELEVKEGSERSLVVLKRVKK